MIYSGNNLRYIREQRGMSQAQLARATNYAAPVICSVELGRRLPWVKLANRLAEILGVSVDDLFPEGVASTRRDNG